MYISAICIERVDRREFVEIKKSATFRPRMIKALEQFATAATDRATLVYEGEDLPAIGTVRVQNWSGYLTCE